MTSYIGWDIGKQSSVVWWRGLFLLQEYLSKFGWKGQKVSDRLKVFIVSSISSQGSYSQKVLGLNVLYKSIEFKPKTWLSPFVNTSPRFGVVCVLVLITGDHRIKNKIKFSTQHYIWLLIRFYNIFIAKTAECPCLVHIYI